MADEERNESLTLIERARIDSERWRERNEDAKATVQNLKEVHESEQAASETRRGLFADAGVGAVRAVPGAFAEAFDLIATIDENAMGWLNARLPDYRFGIDPRAPDDGLSFFKLSPEESAQFPMQSLARPSERGLQGITDLIPETERGSGAVVEPVGKFLLGFFTGKKALQGANILQGTGRTAQIANAYVSGGLADLAVFDGHEARLSDLIQSVPALANPINEFLASDHDDGELEGRLKNVLEGGVIGVAAEGMVRLVGYGIRSIKAAREAKAIQIAVDEARKTETTLPERPAIEEPEIKAGDELVDASTAKPAEEVVDIADDIVIRSDVALHPHQIEALARAAKDGDDEAAAVILKDFNQSNYNWQKIENGEDIKRLLSVTEDVFVDVIDEVKGGVQTNKQTATLAAQVGANAEEITRLFRDVRGDKGITARFYAAQRIMLASAAEMRKLADIAKKTGANADEARLLHQVQVHAALQAEVKGAQTEIARALQAMSILKDSARENFKEFADLKRQFGGKSRSGKQFEKFMDDILDSHSLEELNAKVRWTRWERAKMIFIEYTINSMLSSPKTHAINFTSNVLNTFLYTADRLLGGAYGLLRKGEQAAWRAARIDVYSKMTRLYEAWRLARQAWRDGAPVTDKRQRIEFLTRQAIGMDGETFLARTVNWLGVVIRTPGRMLITGDEFFKAVNRNSEIDVLTYVKADKEAIAGGMTYGSKQYEIFVGKRVKQLSDPDNMTFDARSIRSEAIEKSRLATFQESARTNLGRGAERFVNANAAFKLIFAPFFRTPMNILRQGILDRTPLGLITRNVREQILKGSPMVRREAIARMTTGVAAMAGAWMMFGDDAKGPLKVVGKIPFDSSAKAANIKDYSIQLHGIWYQFNRLDPLGMWLGLVADFKTHAYYNDDDEATFAFGQAAVSSFMNNVLNKTWAKSLSDFQEMAEGIETNKPATIERAINRFVAGEFGKLIPQLFKSSSNAFVEDPTASSAWSFLDNLAKQVPAFNTDLPRRHDALGREIPHSAGVIPIFNPFAISETRDSKLDQEMFRLGFTVRPMAKTLGGGLLELTVDEYALLTGELIRRVGLEKVLSIMVEGEGWENISDELKVALLKGRITEFRTAARQMLIAEGSVAQRIGKAKLNAVQLLLTTED